MSTTEQPDTPKTTKRRRGRRGRGGSRKSTEPKSGETEAAPNESPVVETQDSEAAKPSKASADTIASEPENAESSGQGTQMSSPPASGSNGAPAGGRRRGRRGGRGRRRRSAGRIEEADTAKDADSDYAELADMDEGDDGEETTASSADPEKEDQKKAVTPSPAKSTPAKSTPAKSTPAISKNESVSSGRVMLINVAQDEECRIAILESGRLEELFIERASAESHVGNIYKGRVTNVEPSIQAAFVDFGLPKNGFLHISDLQPQYFPDGANRAEEVGRKTPRRDRPPIQKCLRRGQEVIVQIIKEGIGSKGPTLTTYISIPGRFLVMMPGMNRLGVSRKIEDEEARRKMRTILDQLELPKDMGFILRTAGLDKTKRDLQRDQQYLQRLWKVVAQRIKHERAPCSLYQESDLVIRTIRDVYSTDFGMIVVDSQDTARKVEDFLSLAMPRSAAPVKVYNGHEPLFHKFGVEAEIDRINSRHVPLASGGSLVIDSTEACVTIDVNSGKFRDIDDAEESARRINVEAAKEIARQLRLRDLGGLILCDFIDMRFEKNRRAVERALRDELKKHKERAKCLRTSQFGIIEMTRQRMRPSIKRSIYHDCPHCRGSGLVKTAESMTLDLMRLLRLAVHHDQVRSVEMRVAPEIATQLQNHRRGQLLKLEESTSKRILIRPDASLGLDQHVMECTDSRGGPVRVVDPPTDTYRPERRNRHASPETLQVNAEQGESVFE